VAALAAGLGAGALAQVASGDDTPALSSRPGGSLPTQQAYPSILPSAGGVRQFPTWASRATMVVTQPPLMTLNGSEARLSPGGRIFGDNNKILLSSTLVGQELVVNFTRWPDGLIRDVWVLTDEERKQGMADRSDRQGNFVSGAEEAALELIRRARQQGAVR
jgi:hypothetical protein